MRLFPWSSAAMIALCFATSTSDAATFEKRNYMTDESISPCADLYNYACGKTIASFELPKTRSRHSFAFDDIKEFILTQKKEYFAGVREASSTNPRERAVQSYYLACMNEEGAKAGEKNLVAQTTAEINALETREQFSEFLFQRLQTGQFSFLKFFMNIPNSENWKVRDAYFDMTLLSFGEKSYYEKAELVAEYRVLIETFFKELGLDRAKERAKWVSEFEVGLARVYPTAQEINKSIFSVTEMKPQLLQKMDGLKLKSFIDGLGVRRHVRNFYGDKSFEYMNDAVKTFPLEQLKSVFLFHALREYLDDAYPKFKKDAVAFDAKHFGGVSERPDRTERCVNEVEAKLGKEFDSILLPRIFPNFPKAKLKVMVEKVRGKLVQTVKNNSWLSANAKKEAALKLTRLNIRLVSPETEEEWSFLPVKNYSSTNPVSNRLLHLSAQREKAIQDLKTTFKGPTWEFGPLEVNAALIPMYNAIIFPIGILQPPFYDPTVAEEINMAAIGSVIGHEIGHAIDDKGYTYNHRGQVRPWAKDEDEKKFFARAEPLVQQFNEIGHNGRFTLGENIGDLVGLMNSYQSAFPQGSSKPASLKRDFFVQWARLWCEVQRPELLELRKKTDPHSLGFARANEPVKHLPGFAEAFSCKEGDPLVLPAKKRVNIW